MRFLALALFVVSGCGIAARDGQFLCPDGRCPGSLVCASDGRCRPPGAITDAGMIDAPPFDAPGLDVGPVDAPPLDAPGDAGPPESCVPSATTRAAIDEDMDGAVDEGCTPTYGQPHIVLPPMTTRAAYLGFELLDDGLTGVFVRTTLGVPQAVEVVTRPSLVAPFGPPETMPSTLISNVGPYGMTVDGTGTEIVLGGLDDALAAHLYETFGSVAGRTFGAATTVDELNGYGVHQVLPSMTRDGLELFFVGLDDLSGAELVGTIYHARRAALHGAWTSVEMVGPGLYPRPSFDGRTLHAIDGTTGPVVRRRASRDDTFGPAADFPTFGGTDVIAILPFDFPRTRELFFTYGSTMDGSVPSWAPFNTTIFRNEICPDGDCDSPMVPCAVGTRSPNGLHCYSRLATIRTRPYATAVSECALTGGHLPTIHSIEENLTVRGTETIEMWLGLQGSTWSTGEPFLYEDWAGAAGTGAQCFVLGSAGWVLRGCAMDAAVICETEIWPTWVTP